MNVARQHYVNIVCSIFSKYINMQCMIVKPISWSFLIKERECFSLSLSLTFFFFSLTKYIYTVSQKCIHILIIYISLFMEICFIFKIEYNLETLFVNVGFHTDFRSYTVYCWQRQAMKSEPSTNISFSILCAFPFNGCSQLSDCCMFHSVDFVF